MVNDLPQAQPVLRDYLYDEGFSEEVINHLITHLQRFPIYVVVGHRFERIIFYNIEDTWRNEELQLGSHPYDLEMLEAGQYGHGNEGLANRHVVLHQTLDEYEAAEEARGNEWIEEHPGSPFFGSEEHAAYETFTREEAQQIADELNTKELDRLLSIQLASPTQVVPYTPNLPTAEMGLLFPLMFHNPN